MIRREVTLTDGRPGWAMISQVEHARIAAEVAATWVGPTEPSSLANGQAPVPLAAPQAEFMAAVVHHDDGWLAWELRPTVVDGRPRDFMEMPLDESLAIWRRSIAVAQNFGPLAAYAVGSHFAALCRWSHEKAHHTETWLHLAEEFIEEQEELARDRLAELIAADGVDPSDPVAAAVAASEVKRNADRAWHALQYFDRVSLWLCCAERREPETITVPESLGTGLGAFRFTPLVDGPGAVASDGARSQSTPGRSTSTGSISRPRPWRFPARLTTRPTPWPEPSVNRCRSVGR